MCHDKFFHSIAAAIIDADGALLDPTHLPSVTAAIAGDVARALRLAVGPDLQHRIAMTVVMQTYWHTVSELRVVRAAGFGPYGIPRCPRRRAAIVQVLGDSSAPPQAGSGEALYCMLNGLLDDAAPYPVAIIHDAIDRELCATPAARQQLDGRDPAFRAELLLRVAGLIVAQAQWRRARAPLAIREAMQAWSPGGAHYRRRTS